MLKHEQTVPQYHHQQEPGKDMLPSTPARFVKAGGMSGLASRLPPSGSSNVPILTKQSGVQVSEKKLDFRGKAAKRGAGRQVAGGRGGSPCIQGIPLQRLRRLLHAQAGQGISQAMLHGTLRFWSAITVLAKSAAGS